MALDLDNTQGLSDGGEEAPSGGEILMPHRESKPIYTIREWNSPDDLENRRVSVAI